MPLPIALADVEETTEKAADPPKDTASKTDAPSAAEPSKAEPAKDAKKETPKEKKDEKKPAPSKEAPKEEAAQVKGSRNETRVKMNRMRLRIAERLKESQNSAASLTTFNEIDMSKLIAFRAKYKDAVLKEDGVKLGYMSAFARASVLALQEIPAANASIEGPNGSSVSAPSLKARH